LLAILTGPVGIAVLLITQNFGTIKGIVLGAFNFIVNTWKFLANVFLSPITFARDHVGGIIDQIYNRVAGVVGRIGSAFSGLGNIITAPFRMAVDAIRNVWNSTLGGKVLFPGVFGHGEIDIPRLHSGGVFNSGRGEGLALLKDGETVRTRAQEQALQWR
jgi:hypothetical protein